MFFRKILLVWVGLTLVSSIGLLRGADSQVEKASHRQARAIKPQLEGQQIRLNTFCISKDGNILAACSNNGDSGVVLVYDAQGNLKRQMDTPFNVTAINHSQDGKIFVAGNGKIARLDAEGKVELEVDSPNVGDVEELKRRTLEAAKKQAAQYAKIYETQIESIRKRIEALEKKPADKLSKVEKTRLTAYQRQLNSYEEMSKQLSASVSVESVMANSMRITSIAASTKDVFICCGNLDGPGYAVWRTDHDLKNAKEVLTGLRGCCGQMDVQCCEDQIVVAQNTSFSVGIYDRDGKEASSFGKGDRSSLAGFGSCCNPMNVRAMPDGSILTAESSIGHIKRFKQDGTFVGYVGKARIGGGCKHCAMGYDAKSDQYYMMHQDAGHICVLANNDSLPNGTDEERAAGAVRDKFDNRLLGTWQLGNKKPLASKKASTSSTFGLLGALFGVSTQSQSASEDPFGNANEGQTFGQQATEDNPPFDSIAFHPDGSLKVTGGTYAVYGSKWSWRPVKAEKETIELSLEGDQAEVMTAKITLGGENQAKFALSFYGSDLGSVSGKRILTCDGKVCEECKDTDSKTPPTSK